jgi:hypothetical protein
MMDCPLPALEKHICWNLADAATAEREAASMAAGARLLEEGKEKMKFETRPSKTGPCCAWNRAK